MENKEITLELETIKTIIEKLEQLKETNLYHLTDFDIEEATEDRMSIAREYIECGVLINYLNKRVTNV